MEPVGGATEEKLGFSGSNVSTRVFGTDKPTNSGQGRDYHERIALLLAHGVDVNAADVDGWILLTDVTQRA